MREEVLASSARQRLKCASIQKFGERALKAWCVKFSLHLFHDVNDGSVDKIVHHVSQFFTECFHIHPFGCLKGRNLTEMKTRALKTICHYF